MYYSDTHSVAKEKEKLKKFFIVSDLCFPQL